MGALGAGMFEARAGGGADMTESAPDGGAEGERSGGDGEKMEGDGEEAGGKDWEEVDIFAETPVDAVAAPVGGGGGGGPKAGAGLLDDFDDAEGYYKWRTGEMLADRYEVFAAHGKGVFGSVLRAKDHGSAALTFGGDRPEVAIKMARANETMHRQAQSEHAVLAKLAQADPDNRAHCIRMLDYFEFRGHACLVFESMDMNLRSLVRKFGRNIGLSLQAVRAYAIQLLVGLRLLRQTGILHADIKPDNILVSADRNVIKLCDFGSAMFRCGSRLCV